MTAATVEKPARAQKPAPTAPAAPSTTSILEMAMAMGATFEQALQLVRREEEKAYTVAFAAFSAEAVEIVKTNTATAIDADTGEPSEYDYEDLFNVLDAVKPHLSRHGLTISFDPRREGEMVYVTCTVSHVGGHSKSVTLHAEREDSGGKNHVQAVGSVVTYLERYTAKAILGLAAKGQDRDGRSVQAPAAPAPADPLSVLREAGAAAAKAGLTPLTNWWKKLTPQERKALSGPFGNWRKAAILTDKAAQS